MWISLHLTTSERTGEIACGMADSSDVLLVSAAGYLCSAADVLRAAGLISFAAEVDSFLLILDAEIGLKSRTAD